MPTQRPKFIRIGVANYYDVRPLTDDQAKALPAGAPLAKLADGRVAVRELQNAAGVTKIELPAEVEARLIADAEAAGKKKSRTQLIADHIENTVMPHHSDGEHFVSVSVDDDDELEKYLAARFDIPIVRPNDQYLAAMRANNSDLPAFVINEAGEVSQPAHEETLVTADTEAARLAQEAAPEK